MNLDLVHHGDDSSRTQNPLRLEDIEIGETCFEEIRMAFCYKGTD
jgi:hypothetical protein